MFIRSILLILFNTIYQISCLEPHAPMGKNSSDKTNQTGNFMSKFIAQASFNLFVSFACILDLIFNDNDSVTFLEYILFFLTVSGIIMRFRAYHDLGNLYTFDIGIREDHKLVTTGIYKYIRHPGYTGGFLICIPLWLFTNVNILITLVAIAGTIYTYWNRIKHEEIMLIERFGTEYTQYSSNTKRLIPYIF